mgnify:CR=1 FL=1
MNEFLKDSINSNAADLLVDLFDAIFRGITKYFNNDISKSNDAEKKSKEFNHDTSVELINFVGSIYRDFSHDLNKQTHVRLEKLAFESSFNLIRFSLLIEKKSESFGQFDDSNKQECGE